MKEGKYDKSKSNSQIPSLKGHMTAVNMIGCLVVDLN